MSGSLIVIVIEATINFPLQAPKLDLESIGKKGAKKKAVSTSREEVRFFARTDDSNDLLD